MKDLINVEESSYGRLGIDVEDYAVSLKYYKQVGIPFITAKGKGEQAKQIVIIAEENDIPIEENENLVKLLSVEDVNSAVPEEAFEALAAIFAFVLEENEK